MPAIIRKRNADGTWGDLEKFGEGLTPEERVELLGSQLVQEKFEGMQKDSLINGLGAQVAQMKLEIMMMKGGMQ